MCDVVRRVPRERLVMSGFETAYAGLLYEERDVLGIEDVDERKVLLSV